MSITVYKCDTCKRSIDVSTNLRGLDTFGRCKITQGCRGSLNPVKVLPDHTRLSVPVPISGLTDWSQRKLLFNHVQPISASEWVINHGLGSIPTILAYADNPASSDRFPISPIDIVALSDQSTLIRFDRKYSGIAQCIARGATTSDTITSTVAAKDSQISSGGEIAIAISTAKFGSAESITIAFDVTNTSGGTITNNVVADASALLSPWSDVFKVSIKGKVYTVLSFNGIVPSFLNGDAKTGSTAKISGYVDGQVQQDINSGDIVLLLAKSPFENIDKITNKFIDAHDTSNTTSDSIYYSDGEFFAESSIIQATFPFIRPIK